MIDLEQGDQEEDGGPAFPMEFVDNGSGGEEWKGQQIVSFGLSIRDYFAAKAMAALITRDGNNESTAEQAYAIAADMMNMRE